MPQRQKPTPVLKEHGLYTAPQVAALFNIHVSTLRSWVRAGDFPKPIRFGGRAVRWSGSQIIEYVTDCILGDPAQY